MLHGQQNTVATGGEASGSGGSISYSVGQIDYQMRSDNDGQITEGLQQPYEIFITTAVENPGIQLQATVFPNPVLDRLTLSIERINLEDLHYRLTHQKGSVLSEMPVNTAEEHIQFSTYPEGTYYLSVYVGHKVLQTFKIIKNR
jgi:hypothetical protein